MASFKELNYKEAHQFVNQNKQSGFYWDGWTIMKWTPGHNGFTKTNGMFKNGKWGYSNTYLMTSKGTWLVPDKYVSNT